MWSRNIFSIVNGQNRAAKSNIESKGQRESWGPSQRWKLASRVYSLSLWSKPANSFIYLAWIHAHWKYNISIQFWAIYIFFFLFWTIQLPVKTCQSYGLLSVYLQPWKLAPWLTSEAQQSLLKESLRHPPFSSRSISYTRSRHFIFAVDMCAK